MRILKREDSSFAFNKCQERGDAEQEFYIYLGNPRGGYDGIYDPAFLVCASCLETALAEYHNGEHRHDESN